MISATLYNLIPDGSVNVSILNANNTLKEIVVYSLSQDLFYSHITNHKTLSVNKYINVMRPQSHYIPPSSKLNAVYLTCLLKKNTV